MIAALGRDRTTLLTGAALSVLALAAWVAVVLQAAPSLPVSAAGQALVFLISWTFMMVAMMLPSATPMIALYALVRRKSSGAAPAGASTALFTLVYLAVWVAFGIPVYIAGVLIGAQTQVAALVPYALAGVLVATGIYQCTPLKTACLRVCRHPLSFLMTRTRTGLRGTLGLALDHAVYCLGCCWGLMVVLVAAGAMALHWALLIAAIVFLEKLLPRGEWTARVVGGALVVLGLAVAVHPDLAMLLRPSSMAM